MDSWAKITEEFPNFQKTTDPEQHIKLDETHNPLDCIILKASHHGSKHGTALEVAERLGPKHVAISCKENSSYGFPHELATKAFDEIKSKIMYTYNGTVIFAVDSKGVTLSDQYNDKAQELAPAPTRA